MILTDMFKMSIRNLLLVLFSFFCIVQVANADFYSERVVAPDRAQILSSQVSTYLNKNGFNLGPFTVKTVQSQDQWEVIFPTTTISDDILNGGTLSVPAYYLDNEITMSPDFIETFVNPRWPPDMDTIRTFVHEYLHGQRVTREGYKTWTPIQRALEEGVVSAASLDFARRFAILKWKEKGTSPYYSVAYYECTKLIVAASARQTDGKYWGRRARSSRVWLAKRTSIEEVESYVKSVMNPDEIEKCVKEVN